jgi:hypothetical protein
VSAYLRRCHGEGLYAVVRQRGAAEAGAVFVVADRLDGRQSLYAPAPQAAVEDTGGRSFQLLLDNVDGLAIAERLAREKRFDPDFWVVDVESRDGRTLLDLVD